MWNQNPKPNLIKDDLRRMDLKCRNDGEEPTTMKKVGAEKDGRVMILT
jgi:hypothetical protein